MPHLWSRLYSKGCSIIFAHKQFQWKNNAANNAGVWCVVVGVSNQPSMNKFIFDDKERQTVRRFRRIWWPAR
ncbi:MAG: DNA methyltransferase [Halofilum sp. (in: g-proteobacteria)]|nr:DNA methyltransferase [Halofilum sp. (in: g-proteobacteria)]